MGLTADPDTTVGDLGLAERQLVEICRVLVERPRVLILDEPNSALNERETGRLFAVLRELPPTASRCSTCRTGSRRCSRSPTASR